MINVPVMSQYSAVSLRGRSAVEPEQPTESLVTDDRAGRVAALGFRGDLRVDHPPLEALVMTLGVVVGDVAMSQ